MANEIKRHLVQIEKETKYGYVHIVQFIQDYRQVRDTVITVDRCIREMELWGKGSDDEHYTLRKFTRCMFPDGDKYGNNAYKHYIEDGYAVTGNDVFVPVDMDMR